MARSLHSDPQSSLIFIPDISGFTEFVHTTEISHSQHIIEELLETIIDGNTLDLEVSEIEGDAVLFFRMGEAPSARQLLEQIQTMYHAFHTHLKRYESQRICRCGACGTANNLRLKFVMHYGTISRNKVKTFSKLFGKDLIVAHRLLKNKIDLNEYALFTHDLRDRSIDWNEFSTLTWAPATDLQEAYDFGDIHFSFIPLRPLYSEVPEPALEDFLEHEASMPVINAKTVINAPMQLVFDVVSDVSFRHNWLYGVKDSIDLNKKITQTGSIHRCLVDGTDNDPYQISHSFNIGKELITWIESDPLHNLNSALSLKRIDSKRTQFQQVIQMKPSIRLRLLGPFIRMSFRKRMAQSLGALTEYCEELCRQDKVHSSQIMIEPADIEVVAVN